MKKREYQFALGGFAERADVLEEKTEEAQVAFNFCLAEDYIHAMYDEDFEDLGMMDALLLDDILMWYVRGGGVLEESQVEAIRTGRIITSKQRELVDAVIEDRNDCFAFTFIINGNKDSRLFALCVEEDEYHGLLHADIHTKKDDYLEFLKGIFECIDTDYATLTGENKIKVLSVIKDNVLSIRFPKEIGPIQISDVGRYQFVKDISRKS